MVNRQQQEHVQHHLEHKNGDALEEVPHMQVSVDRDWLQMFALFRFRLLLGLVLQQCHPTLVEAVDEGLKDCNGWRMLQGAVEEDEQGSTLPESGQCQHHLCGLHYTMLRQSLLHVLWVQVLPTEDVSQADGATSKKACCTWGCAQQHESNDGLLVIDPVLAVVARQ